MTIGIAALCEGNILIGASDRMITSGDIQFESEASKILGLTTSLAVMFAGDAALHAEVTQAVLAEVSTLVNSSPTTWVTVQEVAEMFVAHRNAAKRRRAESAVLQPLGLNAESFVRGEHALGPDMIKAIASDLIHFQMPGIEWIVCGIDETGAHIYTVFDGVLSCHDQVGFAAIGNGARHAESQFMLAEHFRGSSLATTLLLTFVAKKRAEVAPGVGAATNMFTAGPALGTLTPLHETVLDRVNEEYLVIDQREREAFVDSRQEMEAYVVELRRAQEADQIADGGTLGDDGADSPPTDEAEPDGEPG